MTDIVDRDTWTSSRVKLIGAENRLIREHARLAEARRDRQWVEYCTE